MSRFKARLSVWCARGVLSLIALAVIVASANIHIGKNSGLLWLNEDDGTLLAMIAALIIVVIVAPILALVAFVWLLNKAFPDG